MQNGDLTSGGELVTTSQKIFAAAILGRIFRFHVVALIATAVSVLVLLGTITNVSEPLAAAFFAIIAGSSIVFPYLTIHHARDCQALSREDRFSYVTASAGISLAQLIFILPVVACVFTPALNFRELLFGLM